MTALFVNHQTEKCGVYQMGARIGRTLADAGLVDYLETWDLGTALLHAGAYDVVIYNWHPSTLPWAPEVVKRYPSAKHVGLIHEIAPDAPHVGAEIFPYRMICDPSFPADGRTTFRSVRHVPRFAEGGPDAPRWAETRRCHCGMSLRPRQRTCICCPPTIGSFGFAVGGKMFATIAHAVGDAFPSATVRLRIPHAHYGDARGDMAMRHATSARAVFIGGVRVEVQHEFLPETALVRWLGDNDLNVFFYEPNGGRGISSVIDYAIAAQRPIAINDSQMFRHVREQLGTYPTKTLRQSLERNEKIVMDLYRAWSPERLVQDYAEMISALEAS